MLDTPGRGWLCTDLYFPNIICDLYVMSNNKARISLCAAARVPGPGKLAVESEMLSQHVWGAEPWQPHSCSREAARCSLCLWPWGQRQLMPEAAVEVARSPGRQESGTKQGLFPQP